MQKKYAGREFYIGLDAAILVGYPSAFSASLVLIPLVIFLSFILPGNHVLVFADLAIIPFVVAMCAPVMKGNVFRITIAGLVTLGIGFFFGNSLAELFTTAALAANFKFPEGTSGAVKMISIGDGFMWPPYLFTTLVSNLGILGLIVLAMGVSLLFFVFLKNKARWERVAGATESE